MNDREQRIIVVGNGAFLANVYSGNGGNLDLGINMVNWLANEERLITVQPRAAKDRNRDQEARRKGGSRTGGKNRYRLGHQIWSYVLQPYQMVKDLRTGVSTSNTAGVLDGDLDEFMQAALAQKAFGGGPEKVEDVE